jgi:hypothetical protein
MTVRHAASTARTGSDLCPVSLGPRRSMAGTVAATRMGDLTSGSVAATRQVGMPEPVVSARATAWPASGVPGVTTPESVLAIQRTAGNRAVTRLLERDRHRVQPVQRQPTGRGGTPAEAPAKRALRLAKLLQGAPPDPAALKELMALGDAELAALEAASLALPRPDAVLVRRAVSFVKFEKTPRPQQPPGATVRPTKPGAIAARMSDVAGGRAEVRIDAVAGDRRGYTLTFTTEPEPATGSTGPATPRPATTPQAVNDAHWLQFAWRSVTVKRKQGARESAETLEARLGRSFSEDSRFHYWLTRDKDRPEWNTDTSSRSSPFFEEGSGTTTRTATKLQMFDIPAADTGQIFALFGDPGKAPSSVVSHFHATAYLVRGMSVLYKADVDMDFTFAIPPDKKTVEVTTTSKAKGDRATKIGSAHRARLGKQFAELDFLPGEGLAIPTMKPGFDPVKASLSGAWPAGTTTEEKFAEIATVAQANRIDSVWELLPGAIKTVANDKDGTAGFPGLCIAKSIAGGQASARFVDANGKLRGRLPVTDRGVLPRVALIMEDGDAFRDKAFALATLRHEMEHARHMELAVDWLAKWRSELPGPSFNDWIVKQKLDVETRSVLDHYFRGESRAPSEVLAMTEGAISALPSLPASPNIGLVLGGSFPAAISELRILGQDNTIVGGSKGMVAVRDTARKRIVDRCRQDPALATKLLAWIDALLDPSLLKVDPGNRDHASAITTIANDFGTAAGAGPGPKQLKGFLEGIRTELGKPARRK